MFDLIIELLLFIIFKCWIFVGFSVSKIKISCWLWELFWISTLFLWSKPDNKLVYNSKVYHSKYKSLFI